MEMTAEPASPTIAPPSSSPYLAMGITFLLLGIGFANPYLLVFNFPRGMWEGSISLQALNLYALTVFLGWGHFFYAWQGQIRGTARLPARRRASYWIAIALVLAMLVSLRGVMGVGLFSVVTWVYNISHFIKAETVFAALKPTDRPRHRGNYYLPAIAFAWFTLVLFQTGPFGQTQFVFVGSLALAALSLMLDWKALADGDVGLPLLTLFLLGETMLWSAYNPSQPFRVGIYIVHVAAASFFHYLGSYFFVQRGDRTPPLLRPTAILAVNAIFLMLGCCVARYGMLLPLRYIFAPEWFTLWVALHLAASDLLPAWKRMAAGPSPLMHPSPDEAAPLTPPQPARAL